MAVVVVESPAKAKTINKYLGKDYAVFASFGHVRDLPAKDGSVDPDNNFDMKWEVSSGSQKHIKAIADALKDDDTLILATDPDREGEAISWHLLDVLKKRRAIKKDTKVERVVFNSITKSAILDAMKAPRDIDMELVDAYLARRALDYLVGFNLSPVLWRKLPGSRSAGRVQSVALRLIVDREAEIDAFDPQEYWTISADMLTEAKKPFEARLVAQNGKKLDKFDLNNEALAMAAKAAIEASQFAIDLVESKPALRRPGPPFMTSTLQQEASRKFNFGARQTMSAAQRLYEAGLITYMRTDGIDMAPEAVNAARSQIEKSFGKNYLPSTPRFYKNKAKNAQEAHECIRPTNLSLTPESAKIADSDQKRLYELIWKRTIASQMEEARFERTTATIFNTDKSLELRASGQVLVFDGFLKVYFEGRDDVIDDDDDKILPPMKNGEAATREAVKADQHFTQPPPRYSEASLIRKMEELGIGRPSTYASIVSTIQERDYVSKENNRLVPNDKGILVTVFLEIYFPKYVSYDFTANLEDELDLITSGERVSKEVLDQFWHDFHQAVDDASALRITEVLERINDRLAPVVFPDKGDGKDPRQCEKCGDGRLSIRTSRAGDMFVGCSNYPDCTYIRPVNVEEGEESLNSAEGKLLGVDSDGNEVRILRGRFGPYVQRQREGVEKPDRASIPKGETPDSLQLEKALQLLSLPREIGKHPEDGEPVEAGLGRFGPYIRHGKTYANLKEVDELFTVGMNRAVELLAEKAARGGRRTAAAPLKIIGAHPDGGELALYDGRYGPYIKWEKVNASLPKDMDKDSVTLDYAIELVNEKKAKGKPARKKKATKKS